MSKLNALYVALLALVVAVAALVVSIVAGGNVENALKAKPELVVNALRDFEVQQREEAEQQVRKMYEENADALYHNAADGFIGNPDGSVVLVEFFDFSCGYCHRVYPVLKNVVAKNPELKIVAKPLAFLSPMSAYAAKAALAAKAQGKFAEVYSAIFEIEGPMTEAKIDEAAVLAGVDLDKLKADMSSDEVNQAMSSVQELANKIRVEGVPTLILNGKLVRTLDETELQKAIDEAK